MPWVSFISDEDLEKEVLHVLNIAGTAATKAKKEFHKNVIDPFSVLFEIGGFELQGGVKIWEKSEEARQAQKTLSTEYGLFHQRILGHIDGWENLGTGQVVDLVCTKRKIVAEIKNKYNTTKGSDKVGIYDDLDAQIMQKGMIYQGYTAYYVEVIPQKIAGKPGSYDEEFTPSSKRSGARRATNPLIRRIDGKRFYELATGEPDALDQLYAVLPSVIEKLGEYVFLPADVPLLSEYFKKAF